MMTTIENNVNNYDSNNDVDDEGDDNNYSERKKI